MPQIEITTEQGRRQFTWEDGTITVGRMPANDVVVPSQHVSRAHAELSAVGGEVWITDLASSYGVWVGEQRVTSHALIVGQSVRIAPDVTLMVIDTGPDAATLPTSRLPAAPQLPLDEIPTRLRIPTAPIPPGAVGGAHVRWLRASEPAVWGPRGEPVPPLTERDLRRPAAEYAGFEDEHDGDVFRRQVTNPNAALAHADAPAGRSAAALVLCATCGERNPLAAVSCHACGHSLALPCAACGLSLLAAQQRCPRCHTPNSGFRARLT
jgi:hypothetical protein